MAAASSTPILRILMRSPNALSNMLEIWALLVIPFAAVFAFGRAVFDFRQGRAIAITMVIVLVTGVGVAYWAEAAGNPLLTAIGVDPSPGNMEGKEVRFGVATSALFAASTTGTSSGAVNSMHDSFMPLGGLVPLFNMLMGCIAPGGVGAGLYGFLVLAVIAVFVAGPHGRPHAGISRQEDRSARDETRHAGGADLSAHRARLLGARR